MNITIKDLFYSQVNSERVEALCPFKYVPVRKGGDLVTLKEMPFESHPFFSCVSADQIQFCDISVDNYGWSTIIPKVCIYNIDSFQIDDYTIRLQFEDGSIAEFEIDSDQFSSIEIY